MKTYEFIDYLTGKGIRVLEESESKAWKVICNEYGSGYVFENVYICIPARKCVSFLTCMDEN